MKRVGIWPGAIGLLAAAACGSDTNDRNDAAPDGERTDEATESARAEGLDLCGLVSEETLTPLREAFDTDDEARVKPLYGAQTFLSCTVGGVIDPAIAWGVRDPQIATNPAVDDLVGSWAASGDVSEIDLDGASAQLVQSVRPDYSGAADRFRVVFEFDGLELLIDGTGFDEAEHDLDEAREFVVDVATEVAANMDGTGPTPVDLPESCPDVDDPRLIEALDGEIVVASAIDYGPGALYAESWLCEYVSESSYAELNRNTRQTDAGEFTVPTPRAGQSTSDVQGQPVRIEARQPSGDLVVEGQCQYRVNLTLVGTAPHDTPPDGSYPSEDDDMAPSAVDELREGKVVAALEAMLAAAPC